MKRKIIEELIAWKNKPDHKPLIQQDPEKAKRLSSLIAYQDMAHGQKAAMIPTDNQYTSQVLYRLGFRWSTTSWDYVDQMLVAISGLGYFD